MTNGVLREQVAKLGRTLKDQASDVELEDQERDSLRARYQRLERRFNALNNAVHRPNLSFYYDHLSPYSQAYQVLHGKDGQKGKRVIALELVDAMETSLVELERIFRDLSSNKLLDPQQNPQPFQGFH